MTVIVTDQGFGPDDWTGTAVPLSEGVCSNAVAFDAAPSDDVAVLDGHLLRIEMVRIAFPSSADGRGFTLARRLRQMGYAARLRAVGHVLADQYAMARRVGFDEVEIDDDLAARQPQSQWLARADWQSHDYQTRLRGGRNAA